jgi:hypothetical protein
MINDQKTKVVCLCCSRELEATLSENEPAPASMVDGGLICSTHGNFGSAVFDPIHGDYRLVFYICDKCIIERKQNVLYVKYEQHTTTKIIKNW